MYTGKENSILNRLSMVFLATNPLVVRCCETRGLLQGILLRLTEIDKDFRVSARFFPGDFGKRVVNEFLKGNGNP